MLYTRLASIHSFVHSFIYSQMSGREGFAIVLNFILFAGVTAVYCLQQIASIEQCTHLAWVLLIPSIVYYTRVMAKFNKHEMTHHCDPPASILTCLMSTFGCLLLLAVSLLHTRMVYHEMLASASGYDLQLVVRLVTTLIAWVCFLATLGHFEYEKLAYVNQPRNEGEYIYEKV